MQKMNIDDFSVNHRCDRGRALPSVYSYILVWNGLKVIQKSSGAKFRTYGAGVRGRPPFRFFVGFRDRHGASVTLRIFHRLRRDVSDKKPS